jgi:Family of unknown function (DUF5947)
MNGSTLGRLVQRSAEASAVVQEIVQEVVEERCELCSEPIPPEHRHMLDLSNRELLCACRACSLLFDRGQSGGDHYRLLPDQVRLVEDFELEDVLWERLQIPVGLAFFFDDTRAGKVSAFYPSPAGPTESLLELGTWDEIKDRNPVLDGMQADVEALLVNRTKDTPRYWLVPLDSCYSLVGLIRTRWKGLSGGGDVWMAIDGFFDELSRKAIPVNRQGEKVKTQSRARKDR